MVGGGNTKRLKQVWDGYMTSQTVRKAEPATELHSEIAEAVTVVAQVLHQPTIRTTAVQEAVALPIP
jgi:hypothetical protein